MTKSRRTLKGSQGYYELLATISQGDLSNYHLAVVRNAEGQARYAVVRESVPEVLQDQELAAAFLRELKVLVRFEHPNLVRVLEAAATQTSYFAILEYLSGEGLGLVVQAAADAGQPLEPALAAGLIAQAADGLDFAHRLTDAKGQPLGVVHSAITPPSIVVDYEGRARLIGFDLHRSSIRRPDTTASSTVAYASPEQCKGGRPDARSDVFSLGVVLWELLARRPLFLRVSHQGTIQAILATAVPPIGAADRGLTPELEAIARRALQPDPGARFQTAGELAAALRGWLQTSGIPDDRAPLAERMRACLADRALHKRRLLDKALKGTLPVLDANLLAPDRDSTGAWPTTNNNAKAPGGPSGAAASAQPEQPQAKAAGQAGGAPAAAGGSPAGPASPSQPPPSQPPEPSASRPPAESSSASQPSRPAMSGAGAKAGRSRIGLWIGLVVVVLLGATAALVFGLGLWPGPGPESQGKDAGPQEPPKPVLAQLSVTSEPAGCGVLLDGKQLPGLTPLQKVDLEPGGAHRLAVRCEGRLEQSLELTAKSGEKITLAFHPDPEPPKGRLRLSTVPRVDVYLNGDRLGRTPLRDLALPAGEHELKLVHPTTKTSSLIKVRIQPDQTTRVFRRLPISRKPG